MTEDALDRLPPIVASSRTRVVFGSGKLAAIGALAREAGGDCVLLVTDPGVRAAGHAARALQSLRDAGVDVHVFDGVEENPTTEHVEAAVATAREHPIGAIVGLGGGSAMDCAKGANFILTNGGRMADYWGVNKARRPMLPMIAIPTTAGTGSEAQSFALIADARTHKKMACGDTKAAPRVAILDPDLTITQPASVAAAAGIDAVAHAVETAATTKRTATSIAFSQAAWARLDAGFERALATPEDGFARALMLLGAHLAGCAIEASMLGAAHACANPLTARYGLTHGVAVGVMLPHVVRHNGAAGRNPYEVLGMEAERLARRVESMLAAAGVAPSLAAHGVERAALAGLAEEAAGQWTAGFNPRPVDATILSGLYGAAFDSRGAVEWRPRGDL